MNYLSQEEIDALVSGTPDTDLATALEAEPFDFSQPPRLTATQQALLGDTHRRLARAWEEYLTARLREAVDVAVPTAELVSFGDVQTALNGDCSCWIFQAGGEGDLEGLIDIEPQLRTHLVDRFFGGPGDYAPESAQPTALELSVLAGAVQVLLQRWQSSWEGRLSGDIEVQRFETNSTNLRLATVDDAMLVITFPVVAAGIAGRITLVLPGTLVTVLLPASDDPILRSDPGQFRDSVISHLLAVRVTVAARLQEFQLSARDLAGLGPGQIIEIGPLSDDQVVLELDGRPLRHGSLGQHEGAIALRVSANQPRGNSPRSSRRRVIHE